MLIDKSERERDMIRFQSAIATRIWLDSFDTPLDIETTASVLFIYTK